MSWGLSRTRTRYSDSAYLQKTEFLKTGTKEKLITPYHDSTQNPDHIGLKATKDLITQTKDASEWSCFRMVNLKHGPIVQNNTDKIQWPWSQGRCVSGVVCLRNNHHLRDGMSPQKRNRPESIAKSRQKDQRVNGTTCLQSNSSRAAVAALKWAICYEVITASKSTISYVVVSF